MHQIIQLIASCEKKIDLNNIENHQVGLSLISAPFRVGAFHTEQLDGKMQKFAGYYSVPKLLMLD